MRPLPIIAAADLIPHVWRFARGDGHLISDRFRFLPGGRIAGHSHPNEASWALRENCLHLLSSQGEVTTVFDEVSSIGVRSHLRGRHRHLLEGKEVMHTLRPNLDDLRFEAEFAGWERPVFIGFNSHGNPYDPQTGTTRWEVYHLPIEEGWNRTRLAERTDPHFWYLNKTRRIVRRLAALLEDVGGPVVICGVSSGGYASMLFGELLTREFPERRITTVSVNPQTVLGPAHQAFYETCVPRSMWPAMIEPDALEQRDIADPNIDQLVNSTQRRRGDIRHVLFYDEHNIGEAYHSAFVHGLPGFELRPYKLGLDHAPGIHGIFDTGDVHEELRRSARA